ncbi:hypothetical protein BaRGS_00028158 [Batillaria attramentaria]|uniref:Uncharacterized protein n=1 Tax=Batillaria attramentaria TaxID=370345 RepID=A0ABD0K0J0_9CAEN
MAMCHRHVLLRKMNEGIRWSPYPPSSPHNVLVESPLSPSSVPTLLPDMRKTILLKKDTKQTSHDLTDKPEIHQMAPPRRMTRKLTSPESVYRNDHSVGSRPLLPCGVSPRETTDFVCYFCT